MLYHFDQYIGKMNNIGKKAMLIKLKSQLGKYSGNRGETIKIKFNHIREKYPEVLI